MDHWAQGTVAINPNFWNGKRVLITGHTGFKGSWLAVWLKRLGADVTGIGLAPNTSPSIFELARVAQGMNSIILDICEAVALRELVSEIRPEVIFHLAAQPLVRASYRDPLNTFSTNFMGTAHILDAARGQSDLRVAIMVTTDKVYRNLEHYSPYREEDTIGGYDPYSASKAACEILIASYRDAYLQTQGVAVASARAGNVIGGGDWSEDRLIPDAVRAWSIGEPLVIRSPLATRPWQHVLEPLAGYLILAETLWRKPELAGAFNFGPHVHEAMSVGTVANLACSAFGKGSVQHESSADRPHEAGNLALEVTKARTILGVVPKWTLAEAVRRTMIWYSAQLKGIDAQKLCQEDILKYEGSA